MADKTFIQVVGLLVGLFAWDADPGAFAASPVPTWAALNDADGARIEVAQVVDGGGETRFEVRCADAGYQLSVVRARTGMTSDEAEAAANGATGLTLTAGKSDPLASVAGDGRADLTADAVALRVAVGRDPLKRLAAGGDGAEAHLNASVGALGPLGGRDQSFPVKGLSAGLAFIDQHCAQSVSA